MEIGDWGLEIELDFQASSESPISNLQSLRCNPKSTIENPKLEDSAQKQQKAKDAQWDSYDCADYRHRQQHANDQQD